MGFLEDAGNILVDIGSQVAQGYVQGAIARRNRPRKRDVAGPPMPTMPMYTAQGLGAGRSSLTMQWPQPGPIDRWLGDMIPGPFGDWLGGESLPVPVGGTGPVGPPAPGGECQSIFTRPLPGGRVAIQRDIIVAGPRGPLYYRNRGRPVLFSGDISFLKSIEKVGRKFARKSGASRRYTSRRRRSR